MMVATLDNRECFCVNHRDCFLHFIILLQPFGFFYRQRQYNINSIIMRNLLLIALSVCLLASCSIKSRPKSGPTITNMRHVKPFEAIDLQGTCDVKFEQGDTFSVKVVGQEDMVKRVITQSDGTTLTIQLKEKISILGWTGDSPVPVIYITSPDLISVKLKGVGCFEMEKPLDTDTLTVYLKGVGDIKFNHIICDEFNGTLIGTGNIEVESLTSQRSFIKLKGTGDADVHFHDSGIASCELEGVGDITLSGTLKSLNKEIKGSGSIDTDDLKVTRP